MHREYESIIGLEIHAQLLTQSKLFCGCSARFGAPPNSQTCPVCLGFPGVLPVFNLQVAEFALKTALALHSYIPSFSRFARKNYFYPDLPKAYQVSQYELPFAEGGYVEIDMEECPEIGRVKEKPADHCSGNSIETDIDQQRKRINLIRIHIEEDAGKLIHGEGIDGGSSFVDFNRSGVPLLEIVTQPEINSPAEARIFLQNLKVILQYLKVCDGNMEEGSLRCDANISVRPCGQKEYGTKTEIKNMNSFRNVQHALEYEIDRQMMLVGRGEKVIQETRLWDADKGLSFPMRGKEEAHDYRYFPEPDLIPIKIDEGWKNRVITTMPELPEAKKIRLLREYNLTPYDAQALTASLELADYFEAGCHFFNNPKMVSNWIMAELLRELNRDNLNINNSPVTPHDLAELLKLIDDGLISGKIAKTVFARMYKEGKKASQIVQEENLIQISDQSILEDTIQRALMDNPEAVSEYKKGKKQTLGFLVGQVMKRSGGKANPTLVNKILIEKLEL